MAPASSDAGTQKSEYKLDDRELQEADRTDD